MSRKTQLIVLTLALFVAVGCLPCLAQGSSGQTSQPAQTSQMGQTAQAGEAQAEVKDALQRIATELNLTDEQKTKIQPILQDEFQQLKAVHENTALSTDQKIAKAKEIHANAKSQIQPILTQEQQTKLATMKEQLKQSWESEGGPK